MKISLCLLLLATAGLNLAPAAETPSKSGGPGIKPARVTPSRGAISEPSAASGTSLGNQNSAVNGISTPLGGPITAPVTGNDGGSATLGGDTTGGDQTTQTFVPAPQGIQPADPITTPITNAPGGTITNLLPQNLDQRRIIDAAGANAEQGTLGSSGAGQSSGGQRPQAYTSGFDEAFGDQFRLSTGQNGATQLAFPDQNAAVTVLSINGSLILQGAVTTEAQRESIETAVSGIAPGTFIDNQIRIIPELDETPGSGGATINP